MIRTLLQIILPATGNHRAVPALAADGVPLADLLTAGDLDSNDFLYCPEEQRTTFHALHSDGSRTCWTCQTTTRGDQ